MNLENGMTPEVLAESTWRAWRHAQGKPVEEGKRFQDAPEREALPLSQVAQFAYRVHSSEESWAEVEGKGEEWVTRQVAEYLGLSWNDLEPRERLCWQAAVRHAFGLCDADDWGHNLASWEAGWESWVERKLGLQPAV